MLRPLTAFLLSFTVGFVFGLFLFAGLFGWLGFLLGAQFVLYGTVLVGLVLGVFTGLVGLGMFYLWRALGKPGQLGVVALLLAAGILLAQPELDALAVIGFTFTLLGVRGGRPR